MKINIFKQMRISAGLSQNDVAVAMGYSTPQFISNWERGVSYPPIERIRKVAKLYNVDPEKFFDIVFEAALAKAKQKMQRKFKSESKGSV